MEVIHSVPTPLGGEGISNTSFHAVYPLYLHNSLKGVMCLKNNQIIIDKRLVKTPLPYGWELHTILGGLSNRVSRSIPHLPIINTAFDLMVARNLQPCDIFHCWISAAFHSLKKAKKIDARTCAIIGSIHPEDQYSLIAAEYRKFGIPYQPVSGSLFSKMLKEMKAIDYYLPNSTFVRDSLIKRGFPKDRIFVLPLGCDTKRFYPQKKRNRKLRFLYVGSVTLRKGVHYLLEAWQSLKLKNAELIIAGSVHREIENIIAKYRADKSIQFLGFVDDLPVLYRSCDVFVLPSVEDGFALVVPEAMCSRLPVIITENTGSKDIVQDGSSGFVIPIRNSDALARKMRYFYDNPKEIMRMGANARKAALRYDWKTFEKRILRQYERFVE